MQLRFFTVKLRIVFSTYLLTYIILCDKINSLSRTGAVSCSDLLRETRSNGGLRADRSGGSDSDAGDADDAGADRCSSIY